MKRLFITLLVAFVSVFSLKALSYEEARREAWFLTDKMAYELNLTSEQYDEAYQVNLDYFLSIRRASDCTGRYWRYRDMDLRCILFPWQYNLYASLDYFFRPIHWRHSCWYFPICSHYRRGYYYFRHPVVYVSYRGNSWRHRGHKALSPYHGRIFKHGVGLRDNYYKGTGHRPQYRPDFGKPPRHDRDDHFDHDKRPGVGNRPGIGHRPDKGDRPGIGNRPGRGDRPSHNWGEKDKDKRPGFHGGKQDRPSHFRPSRDFKQDKMKRDKSDRSSGHSRREFGRD